MNLSRGNAPCGLGAISFRIAEKPNRERFVSSIGRSGWMYHIPEKIPHAMWGAPWPHPFPRLAEFHEYTTNSRTFHRTPVPAINQCVEGNSPLPRLLAQGVTLLGDRSGRCLELIRAGPRLAGWPAADRRQAPTREAGDRAQRQHRYRFPCRDGLQAGRLVAGPGPGRRSR